MNDRRDNKGKKCLYSTTDGNLPRQRANDKTGISQEKYDKLQSENEFNKISISDLHVTLEELRKKMNDSRGFE
jgi:hypothetical protein